MPRDDYPALHALGFEDDELKELGLWVPAVGSPAELAEIYVPASVCKSPTAHIEYPSLQPQ
ncbi:hypothetical protein GCM10010206_79370 [Streptomyces cinerochromogenes]|nr:hypothetical protein GCM10010206_79370 [Streptomyces cinerochromogenes]